ncbi:MAG: hypothetical protein IT381_12470 [Deltaproteobacteria bacterium]|nr:hypothetical protein [Deltaproteobacteria bacterium]
MFESSNGSAMALQAIVALPARAEIDLVFGFRRSKMKIFRARIRYGPFSRPDRTLTIP